MITVITEFTMVQPVTAMEAREIFNCTAPNYLGVPGLLHKTYLFPEDGKKLGGVYVWESREAAEALFTEEWRAKVRRKYGTAPKVRYFDNLVTVDNLKQEISTKEE